MRRTDRQITDRARIEDILRRCRFCRLGLVCEGEPYVVPLCFGYDGQAVYLHMAVEGKKAGLPARQSPRLPNVGPPRRDDPCRRYLRLGHDLRERHRPRPGGGAGFGPGQTPCPGLHHGPVRRQRWPVDSSVRATGAHRGGAGADRGHDGQGETLARGAPLYIPSILLLYSSVLLDTFNGRPAMGPGRATLPGSRGYCTASRRPSRAVCHSAHRSTHPGLAPSPAPSSPPGSPPSATSSGWGSGES
jgi:hypothetical protein